MATRDLKGKTNPIHELVSGSIGESIAATTAKTFASPYPRGIHANDTGNFVWDDTAGTEHTIYMNAGTTYPISPSSIDATSAISVCALW